MDIQLIDTGFFHADGGAMFGAIPKTAWSRRYPSDKQNGCILAMRSMLVRDGNGKIVLVDNGAGNKHLKQLSYYNFFDLVDLKDELQRRDVACEDVTDVILTHLHFDHCGYTTQKEEQTGGKPLFKMAFPNAIHWVSRAQWENFLHPNALEADSYFIEKRLAPLDLGIRHLSCRFLQRKNADAGRSRLRETGSHLLSRRLYSVYYREKGERLFQGRSKSFTFFHRVKIKSPAGKNKVSSTGN